MLILLCPCVCMLFYACPLLLLYFVWAVQLCALGICPCSHFQMSVSVFRLEVLRCSRPVPPILQTTADPSSDKASLCVFGCAGHRVFVRDRHVLKYARVFSLLWAIWGKPFVTGRIAPHSLGSAPGALSDDTGCYMLSQDRRKEELRKVSPKATGPLFTNIFPSFFYEICSKKSSHQSHDVNFNRKIVFTCDFFFIMMNLPASPSKRSWDCRAVRTQKLKS